MLRAYRWLWERGVKMIDVVSMILTQRIMTLKSYFGETKVKLPENYFGWISSRYRWKTHSVLQFWHPQSVFHLSQKCASTHGQNKGLSSVVTYEEIVEQIIWNNKKVTIGKESFFVKHLFSLGIVKIGDLLSDTGKFFKSLIVLVAKLSPLHFFLINEYCRCHTKWLEADH